MKRLYTLLLMLAMIAVFAQAQGNPIEGYTELDRSKWGDILGRYRYELTYDKEGWRKTEYVYYSEKVDGKWEFKTEELFDIGTYSYEFDTQGRVKVKAVTYEMDNKQSYRIMADYTSTPVKYTKYAKDGGSYEKKAEWTCHDNGAVAAYTDNDGRTAYYTESGEFLGDAREGGSLSRTGVLNDSTITYDGSTERYRYDAKTGRLLEYSKKDYGNEKMSLSFEYDKFGRISKWKEAYTDGIGDDFENIDGEATITYFNDEVYPIGNSWRDVFFMEGPIAKVVGKNNGEVVYEITYNRDSQGMLTGVTEKDYYGEYESNYKVQNGHITEKEITWKNGPTDVETYTWQGENVTKVIGPPHGDVPDVPDTEKYMETIEYTHGDGTCTMKMHDTYDDANNSYYVVKTTEKDGKYNEQGESYYNGKKNGSYQLMRDIQREDFCVTRPNMGKDLDGFCPEVPVPVSVKDRVAVVGQKDGMGYAMKHGFVENTLDYFDGTVYMWYVNMGEENYYSVKHEGNLIMCYDSKERPVFAVLNGKLMKEYWYDDRETESLVEIDTSAPALAPRKAEAETAMKNVTVIEYLYNNKGWCTGQTITIYDENGGGTTDEYTYQYDMTPVTGIRADGQGRNYKVAKDGHIYIVRDGHWYTTTGILVR
ncbi:MAG: hypothetical protein IJ197_05725 [Bacteroidaceae bacterium]|nr:hypothetical protein [Bacteroidaceae bacterium]